MTQPTAAKFYAEGLGIPMQAAERIAAFMELATNHKALASPPSPWVKHGKIRVYFKFWSQNSLPAIRFMENSYYDAEADDVFVKRFIFTEGDALTLRQAANLGNAHFSGAKTRGAVKEFAEAFYETRPRN